MCTLSVLRQPLPSGDDEAPLWRVKFNRDERRTRPPALPPVQHIYEEHVAVHPIDPQGGGTWVAVSSAGLVFALLNGYSESDAPSEADGRVNPATSATSRGLIIPTLLSADTLALAATRARALDPTAFLSFRLVIVSDEGACEIVHGAHGGHGHGRQLEIRDVEEGDAWMRSSSSVRPGVVLPHRRALFDHEVAASRLAVVQDRFHLTRHADDSALGVLMERDDARTMSVTTVEVFAAHARMTYRALEPDATPATVDIARQRHPR